MSFVKTAIKDRVGYITLNRPEKRNALNQEFALELTKTFKAFEEDEDVKVIVLQAEGSVFCAGADLVYLEQLQKNTYEENLADSMVLRNLFQTIYSLDKVVVGKIQGHAIAGGCGLATVCDIAVAVDTAKFGYTEVKIGFIPAIVMPFLLRKVGEATAKKILLTGDILSASEAASLGIISETVSINDLDKTVAELALKLVKQCSGSSLASTKKLFLELVHLEISEATEKAAALNASSRNTPDCKAGISAFLNKEKKEW